jgi:hypothetical protein
MQLDDDICYCYHVSMRKLVNFSRRVRPARASQMTECLGPEIRGNRARPHPRYRECR